jgi:hypothetical protein
VEDSWKWSSSAAEEGQRPAKREKHMKSWLPVNNLQNLSFMPKKV